MTGRTGLVIPRLPSLECKVLDDALRSTLLGEPLAVQRAQGALLSCLGRNDEQKPG